MRGVFPAALAILAFIISSFALRDLLNNDLLTVARAYKRSKETVNMLLPRGGKKIKNKVHCHYKKPLKDYQFVKDAKEIIEREDKMPIPEKNRAVEKRRRQPDDPVRALDKLIHYGCDPERSRLTGVARSTCGQQPFFCDTSTAAEGDLSKMTCVKPRSPSALMTGQGECFKA